MDAQSIFYRRERFFQEIAFEKQSKQAKHEVLRR